jgi:hypothetical protein
VKRRKGKKNGREGV